MWFSDWQTIGRTAAVGFAAYLTLILFLRVSGKRTLSKMNAFDFVVTVALGSTLATILLSNQTTLAQGAMAFLVLIFGQYVITWLSVRSQSVQKLVKADPALLYYEGRYLEGVLRSQRVTREEVEAAAREQGLASLEQAQAVVLETDGSLSVVRRWADPPTLVTSLKNAPGSPT